MKRLALVCSIALLGLVVALTLAWGEQRRPNRGRGGARQPNRGQQRPGPQNRPGAQNQRRPPQLFSPQEQRALYLVDNCWEGLPFELKVTDETLNEVRPSFQKAWDARKEAARKLKQSRNKQPFVKALQKLNDELLEALKESLSPAEMKQLRQWLSTGKVTGGRGGGLGLGTPGELGDPVEGEPMEGIDHGEEDEDEGDPGEDAALE